MKWMGSKRRENKKKGGKTESHNVNWNKHPKEQLFFLVILLCVYVYMYMYICDIIVGQYRSMGKENISSQRDILCWKNVKKL